MRLTLPFCLMLAAPLAAQHGAQPYAGLEKRGIAALSERDITELEAGRGWGLALPAELNGHPGPVHVLEHAAALGLSEAQHAQITQLFAQMQTEAIAAGHALIAAEQALDEGFAASKLTPQDLQRLVETAANARGALRLVHLSRHLRTVEILTKDQIARYQVLRGYADDPCAAVPEGHNAEMWLRHNGCE